MPNELVIPFYHHYDKFKEPMFTTIRGKTFGKGKLKVGKSVRCEIFESPKATILAVVEDFKQQVVADIGLDVLAQDGRYPGCEIADHSAFCDLVNSLRKSWMPRLTLDSIVTIITLLRTSPYEKTSPETTL